MRIIVIFLLVNIFSISSFAQQLTIDEADHLASLALSCITREYPNKPGHVMDDSLDVRPPSDLHPAFYGCFDWHSSVHGHWMLIHLLREYPEMPSAGMIRKAIAENITAENILREKEYFEEKSNRSFERTYGWAWLLKLAEELHTWDDPFARQMHHHLKPLADKIVVSYYEFLPKLTFPNRTGEHPNTAFGMSFAWDYADAAGIDSLKALIENRSRDYYSIDRDCPAEYEPGGTDFLSPCLAEADMMARVLPEEEFLDWLEYFLPGLGDGSPARLFTPAAVSERSDGKLVHLDGLNFSRAWCFYRIAENAPGLREVLIEVADKHLAYSLPAIASGEYSGEHWLASFAVYAITSRSKSMETGK